MGRAVGILAVALGTGLGAGFSPVAPGTAGSVLGVLLYLPFAGADWRLLAIALAVLVPVGVWAAGVCGERYGAHDHGRIVVDEVAGQLVALAGLPADPGWLLASFVLFRVYDIVKPFPARRIDRGWRTPAGVVADDLVAGVYANLTLRAARALLGG